MTLQETGSMANIVSASRLEAGIFSPKGKQTQLQMAEIKSMNHLQLAFFPDQMRALQMAFKKQFGLAIPQLSARQSSATMSACRAEIGKIWLFSDRDLSDLPSVFDKFYPTIMTSSRVGISLKGPKAAEVIKRQTAIDLRGGAGRFMATGMHHIPVHVLMQAEDDFLVLIPRSYAESLGHLLFEIATQFGVKVTEPVTWSSWHRTASIA